jgi:predicted DNA-binding transcriptional regulator AlpA
LPKKPAAKKAAAHKRATRVASAAHARAARVSPSTPPTPELKPDAEKPSIGERLLSKAEVCRIVGATFPTIWAWQRAGKFPRSRSVGGKSMWLESEVRQWMQALPVRRLKGDAEEAE